jgi:hypothetical protein
MSTTATTTVATRTASRHRVYGHKLDTATQQRIQELAQKAMFYLKKESMCAIHMQENLPHYRALQERARRDPMCISMETPYRFGTGTDIDTVLAMADLELAKDPITCEEYVWSLYLPSC